MRYSLSSPISAKTLLAVVGFGLLGACADSANAPSPAITAKNRPAGYDNLVGASTFIWSPTSGATKRFGDHVIVIPAGAVCDPATSTYGVGHWDEDCDPATSSIVITALTYTDAGGHPYVDFQPALRFVPTSEVYLYLRDGIRDGRNTVEIAYCATTTCADESLTDPSLATQRVGKTRTLYRRLKHFSGYAVSNANECLNGLISLLEDGTLFCDEPDLPIGLGRSGYVVASGLSKTTTAETFGRRRRADR